MGGTRLLAVALLVGGVLALVYGGFTYTKEASTTELGPISIEVKDRERVNVPVWAGVAMVAVGGGLLLIGGKRSG
jgi:hypothetical protein